MGERYSQIAQSEQEARKKSGITRRNLIKTAAITPPFIGLGGTSYYLHSEERKREAYDRNFLGFDPLTTSEFYELIGNHTETSIPLAENEPQDAETLRDFNFTLEDSSQVYFSIVGSHNPFLFVEPLVVQSDNKRRYIAPLVHTDDYNRSPIRTDLQLGYYEEGEHKVTVRADKSASFPRMELPEVFLTKPSENSLLARFMQHNPVVTLKNQENLLDDIPLKSFCNIGKKDDLYKVTTNIIFSSENGGLKPPELLNNFQRTIDVEWVMEQLFTSNGEVIKDRRRLQTKNHGSRQFGGWEMSGNRPVLETATANNLFSDGRVAVPFTNLSFDNPFDSSEDDEVYYSPKPVFLPGNQGSSTLLAEYPEMQRWSFNEVALEGCVDKNNPLTESFFVELENVDRYINAIYPNRGCQNLITSELPEPE